MNYPTLEEVEKADREQICRWWRFLPSPGAGAVGRDDFTEVLNQHAIVLNRIGERLGELGGFSPEISKKLGWDKEKA
jgi:hypothetical protein